MHIIVSMPEQLAGSCYVNCNCQKTFINLQENYITDTMPRMRSRLLCKLMQ